MASRTTVIPFAAEHLDGASALLTERHRAQRLVEPALDPAFEDPAQACSEVEALYRTAGASGVAAVLDGDVVGFLIGVPREAGWGPNVWVKSGGHAVVTAELVLDLYAAAAERWVADGKTSHYAIVPATDAALVDAWFRLGFGQQHAHAIMETPPASSLSVAAPRGVDVRPARRSDLDALAQLELAMSEHQRRAPVFASGSGTFEEIRAEWEADFDDEKLTTLFVATRNDAVVGASFGCPIDLSPGHEGLARPPGAALLSWASVFPEHRGLGIGHLLGARVLAWAAEGGYPTTVVDWRTTNLLASRAWPKLGFRPTFYRLHRAIA